MPTPALSPALRELEDLRSIFQARLKLCRVGSWPCKGQCSGGSDHGWSNWEKEGRRVSRVKHNVDTRVMPYFHGSFNSVTGWA